MQKDIVIEDSVQYIIDNIDKIPKELLRELYFRCWTEDADREANESLLAVWEGYKQWEEKHVTYL